MEYGAMIPVSINVFTELTLWHHIDFYKQVCGLIMERECPERSFGIWNGLEIESLKDRMTDGRP